MVKLDFAFENVFGCESVAKCYTNMAFLISFQIYTFFKPLLVLTFVLLDQFKIV